MKKFPLKGMMPYIIINTLLYAILGAIIGKVTVEVLGTKKIIDKDWRLMKKFIKDMGSSATHIKISDIAEDDVPEDIREKADDPKETMGD